jgi:hypothetical protein
MDSNSFDLVNHMGAINGCFDLMLIDLQLFQLGYSLMNSLCYFKIYYKIKFRIQA